MLPGAYAGPWNRRVMAGSATSEALWEMCLLVELRGPSQDKWSYGAGCPRYLSACPLTQTFSADTSSPGTFWLAQSGLRHLKP